MSDLEKRVLDTIAKRKLAPTPAYVFLAKRAVLWALAGAALLLGALSFALLFYVVTDYFATGLRGVDNMPLDEFVPALPLIWLVSLVFFLVSASIGLRHTPRGYRFSMLRLFAVALAASVLFGAILHFTGAGSALNAALANRFPAYERLTHVPFEEWSHPDRGRLSGTVTAAAEGRSLTLIDFNGVTWTVDISAASIRTGQPPLEEGDVAITGMRTGPTSFKADIVDEFD